MCSDLSWGSLGRLHRIPFAHLGRLSLGPERGRGLVCSTAAVRRVMLRGHASLVVRRPLGCPPRMSVDARCGRIANTLPPAAEGEASSTLVDPRRPSLSLIRNPPRQLRAVRAQPPFRRATASSLGGRPPQNATLETGRPTVQKGGRRGLEGWRGSRRGEKEPASVARHRLQSATPAYLHDAGTPAKDVPVWTPVCCGCVQPDRVLRIASPSPVALLRRQP
jgi:hypothetical protein